MIQDNCAGRSCQSIIYLPWYKQVNPCNPLMFANVFCTQIACAVFFTHTHTYSYTLIKVYPDRVNQHEKATSQAQNRWHGVQTLEMKLPLADLGATLHHRMFCAAEPSARGHPLLALIIIVMIDPCSRRSKD